MVKYLKNPVIAGFLYFGRGTNGQGKSSFTIMCRVDLCKEYKQLNSKITTLRRKHFINCLTGTVSVSNC